jgi:glycerol transport system permease protein
MTTMMATSAAGKKTSRFRIDLRSWLFWLIMAVWSLPLIWLISMSFRDNADILSKFEVIPTEISLNGYTQFFEDSSWIGSYMNSITYTLMNTVLSLIVALPAAYAFSRFTFSGDKHLFFWLLTNRMAPAAVFLLPFFQLYQAVDLFDTPLGVALAHMLFNVPLAVWILEGFMSGVPKQLG